MFIKSKILLLASLLLFIFIFMGASSAANHTASPGANSIQNAVNTAASGDTLNLNAGTYNEHDIIIDKDLTIIGPEIFGANEPVVVINGQGQGRVFNIVSGVTVTLQNLKIEQGTTTGDGGGIYNSGTVNLNKCTITQNTAATGGGIYNNQGTVTLTDSQVTYNTASSTNTTSGGSGIYNHQGTLNIIRTAINFNSGWYSQIAYDNNPQSVNIYDSWQNPSWKIETADSPGYVGEVTCMDLDSNNNPHILYWDRYGSYWKYAYKLNGVWYKETIDNAPITSNAFKTSANCLVIDIQGAPHVLYQTHEGGLKYAYKQNGEWHKEIVDSSGGLYTSMALDNEGNPHICYESLTDPTNGKIVYRVRNPDMGWTNPIKIGGGLPNTCPTSIQVDENNNPHIAYFGDINSGHGGLCYAYQKGSGWKNEFICESGIYTPFDETRNVSLALDSEGNPHILCLYLEPEGWHFVYCSREDSSWNPVWNIDTLNDVAHSDSGRTGIYNSLIMDSQGIPHICYNFMKFDSGNYGETSLRYQTQNANGDWNTPVVVETYPTQASSSPQDGQRTIGYWCCLALDSNGNPCISYFDDLNKDLVYAYYQPTQAPLVTASPRGSVYNSAQMVSLTTVDPDSTATTYYTLDLSDPRTSWTRIIYTNPIEIAVDTPLLFCAVDPDGNWSDVYSQHYLIDTIAPTVNVNPLGSTHNGAQTVTLTTVDNNSATTYYTTDGSDPTINGQSYNNPIQINTTTVLRYAAVDPAGNWSPIYIQTYVIDTSAPIVTANPLASTFNGVQMVTLTTVDDSTTTTYYTTDGSDPTINGQTYVNPIQIATSTVLKYAAVDFVGNWSQVYSQNYVMDNIAPTASATPIGGNFNTVKIVNLNMSESGTIYYTTDGSKPTINSSHYSNPINIANTTTLKFLAVDLAGNQSPVYTEIYNIDITAPTASATPVGGSYNTSKTVNLNMSEAGTIYYTLNGTTPTKNSAKYTAPLNITSTKTLKFLAVDLAGNQSSIYTQKYIIDKTAPKVSTSNPINGKTGVKRNQTITVTFNENIKTGTNYSKITLKSSTGKTITITKSISGKVLTIKHSSKFAAKTKYILTLYSGCVRDLAGNPVAAKTITFTTGSS